MKKIITSLLLSMSFFQSSFGQKDLTGVYFNESGAKIEIKGNNFIYIEPHIGSPIWYNDTLATCSFKWVDEQFIELNSTPAYVITQEGFKMTQSLDSSIKDSIKVSFSIPYDSSNLDISVSTNTFKTFNLNYSKNNRELMLPSNTKKIDFSISPGMCLAPHTVDGLYYGVLYYPSFEYDIEKNVNSIEFKIPAIDNSFFEKYYVKGDYAYISKNSITWKGNVFTKKKRFGKLD